MAACKGMNLVAIETRPLSDEYPWEFIVKEGYEVERFPVNTSGKSILGEWKSCIVKIFDRYQPNVVVTTGWADSEYHKVILEAVKRNIPRVVISDSRHEDEPRKFYKEFIKRLILKAYSSALVAGTSSKNYIVKLGFPSDAVFQPWDVVDNNYFSSAKHQKSIPFQQRYFLCVSRFITKKNLHKLIEAFSVYRAQGGKRELVLAGSGELEDSINLAIAKLNMTDVIRLEGFVQYERLPSYLANAISLILPSTSDQWGLVVNEAQAAGIPVLVSVKCGCAVDLVHEGDNGYLFDPFDLQSMVKALQLMDQKNEHEWSKMSLASEMSIKHWDLQNFADGLEKTCHYALRHHVRHEVKIVHRLLSR